MASITDTHKLARKLIEEILVDQHGIHGWTFQLDNARRRLGACHYHKRIITMSRHLIPVASKEEVKETILHEIAHAIAGAGANHGPKWQQVAKSIGCTAQRCHNVDTSSVANYIGECDCDTPHHRVRRPRRGYTYTCRRCRAVITFKLKRRY